MAKPIDSIGPRPDKKQAKPVVEHKAGQVVRPKGAAPKAGDTVEPLGPKVTSEKATSNTGKPGQPKQPVNKRKLAIIGASLVGLVLVTLGVIYLVRGTQLLSSLTKPKPPAGTYAEVGDQAASQDEYNTIKDSYSGFNSKQAGPLGDTEVAQQASKDLVTYLALKSEANKNNIICTQEIVDNRLASKYSERGGKDAFYAYLEAEYGWDPAVTFVKECSEYYRAELDARIVGGTDVFGVYIRWDRFAPDTPSSEKDAYAAAAKDRLEKEFAPLFARGASKEEIYRKADISPYTSDAEFDEKMKSPGQPYVRTVEYPMFNDYMYSQFQKYSEGEDDTAYISKLAIGDSTPVFKSKVGYYAIFRATDKKQGTTQSVDQLVEQYLAEGKYSNQYYSLPPASSQDAAPQYDLNNVSANSVVDRISQAVVPRALAVSPNSVGCFTGFHSLPMQIRYSDYYTGVDIPLQQLRDDKGAPVATLQITSTGDVQTDCYDEPASINGAYGALNVGYWGGALVYDVYDYHINPWNFGLSCYSGWRFYFNKVVGYEPVNYGDASQFEVTLTKAGFTDVQRRASAYSDYYRIPTDMYHNVANGASGYGIRVFMKKEPPPDKEVIPYMTIQGYKVDEAKNGGGPYAGATVREAPDGVTSAAQPYVLPNLRADKYHEIRPDAVAGYDVVGYLLNGSDTVVNATKYAYTAGTKGNGQSLDLWWVYRKQPTVNFTVACDTVTGSVEGGAPGPVSVVVRIGDDDLPAVDSRNFSVPIPETYRDGVSRSLQLRVTMSGGTTIVKNTTHSCSRNAVCSADNLTDVFPQNRATLNVGDQESGVRMRMTNTGSTPPAQAIWGANASTGTYRLELTPTAAAFWNISNTPIPSDTKIYPTPGSAGQATFYDFSGFTLTLKATPNSASIPLGFQMAFVASDGTVTRFGAACSTNLRVLSAYGPWLRSQNGNIAALGNIVGQPPLTSDGRGLGGRNATGTNNDLNLEATYMVMSAASSNGPFCSTNAYLLGRGDDINDCSFDQYTFRLGGSLASALSATDSSEVIFRDLDNGVGKAASCAEVNTSGNLRYIDGGGYNGSVPQTPGEIDCPRVYRMQQRSGEYILGTPGNNPVPNMTVRAGRTTLLVDGNLRINANLQNQNPGNFTYNVDDMRSFNGLPNLGIVVKGDIIIDGDVTRIDASLYATGTIKTCEAYSNNATTGQKNEVATASGAVTPNADAAQCSKQLSIRGLAAAKKGFEFGRNYVSFGPLTSTPDTIAKRVGADQYAANFEYNANRGLYFGKPAEDVIYNGLLLFAPPPGFEYLTSPDLSSASYTTDSAQPRF